MLDNEIDYERIKARVEKRMALRAKFYRRLSGYVTANIIVWSIWLFTDHSFPPWPLFVTFFAGIGVVRLGLQAFFGESLDAVLERQYDSEMQKEILREKRRTANNVYAADPYDTDTLDAPKRKNGTVRLSDDGELIYDEPEHGASEQDTGL